MTDRQRLTAAQADFICAICDRQICMRWNRPGPDATIPPLCRGCEHQFSGRDHRLDSAGSYLDRRIVRHGIALAGALNAYAHSRRWEETHAAS